MRNKSYNKIYFFLFIFFIIFLISCQNFSLKNRESSYLGRVEDAKNVPAPSFKLQTQDNEQEQQEQITDTAKAPGGENQITSGEDKNDKKYSTQAATNRYIIRSATMNIFVLSVFKSVKSIEKTANNFEGFISDSTLNNIEGSIPAATLTLRVPEKHFDKVIELIEKTGTVTNKNIKGEDVTTEFVDTQARLRNLQKQEQQYLKILEQAYTIKDILAVTEEITKIRGQIETTTSRLKKLSNLVSLSTITVSLTEKTQSIITTIWDFSPTIANSWTNAANSLASLIKQVIRAITTFIVYIPVLIIIIFLFWIAWAIAYKIFVVKNKIVSKRTLGYIFIGICLLIAGVWQPFLFIIYVSLFLLTLMIHFILWLVTKFTRKTINKNDNINNKTDP